VVPIDRACATGLLCAAIVGCAAKPGPPAIVRVSAPAPVPDETPPAPPVVAPAVTPPTRLALHLVAHRDDALLLHHFADQLMLVGAAAFARIEADGQITRLDEHPGDDLPVSMLGGIDLVWHTWALGGRWPDEAWLVVSRFAQVAFVPTVHRYERRGWTRRPAVHGPLYWYYRDIITWPEGQVLGLKVYEPDPWIVAWRYELGTGDDDPAHPDPAPLLAHTRPRFELLGPRPRPAWPRIAAQLEVVTAAAAPDGALFLLAYRGKRSDGVAVVQRWDPARPAERAGVVDILPGRANVELLRVDAAGIAHVGGAQKSVTSPYLARFDGTTWTEIPAPEGRRLHDLARAPDGVLWAITDQESADEYERDEPPGALARQGSPEAEWEPIELAGVAVPAMPGWEYSDDVEPVLASRHDTQVAMAVDPRQVVVRADGELLIRGAIDLGGIAPHEVILSSRPPPGPPLLLPGDRQQWAIRDDARPTRPLRRGTWCEGGLDPFILVRPVPRGTPDDAPIAEVAALVNDPGLRPKIRGIHEFERAGRRVVGLFYALDDDDDRTALLAALARVAPGVRRVFECRRPPIRRVLWRPGAP
jgi:hypothetical protein